MSIFDFIGHLFLSLFNSTKAAWEKLPTSTQNGIVNGQGILNIINQGANESPATIALTIQSAYPNEDVTAIYTGLVSVAKSLNILPATVPSDLTGIVALIQPYLKTVDDSIWPAIIQGAANILGLILSGGTTPFEVISTLAQFVYTNFIKTQTVTFVQSAPPAPSIVTPLSSSVENPI